MEYRCFRVGVDTRPARWSPKADSISASKSPPGTIAKSRPPCRRCCHLCLPTVCQCCILVSCGPSILRNSGCLRCIRLIACSHTTMDDLTLLAIFLFGFCALVTSRFRARGKAKGLPLPPGPNTSWFRGIQLPKTHPWLTYARWKDIYGRTIYLV